MSGFHGLTARLRTLVELHTIVIKLSPYGPPEISLTGRTKTGNRKVDTASEVTVSTLALGPAGVKFIREMQEALQPSTEPDQPDPVIGRPPKKKD